MENSPFSRLSAELRNQIWGESVTQQRPIHVESHEESTSHPAYQPALTKVCKKIRQEALLLFYSNNDFIIDAPGQDCVLSSRHRSDDIDMQHHAATVWLEGTPLAYHKAVRSLTFIAQFGDDDVDVDNEGGGWDDEEDGSCVSNDGFWNPDFEGTIRNVFVNLAKLLRDLQYAPPRFKFELRFFHADGPTEYCNLNGDFKERAKNAIERIGLPCDVGPAGRYQLMIPEGETFQTPVWTDHPV